MRLKHAVIAAAVGGAAVCATIVLAPGHYDLGVLPDPAKTPGIINAAITQDNLDTTLCNSAWSTKSIRPPASYTTKLKVQQLAGGYALNADANTKDYEEDHLISLELGGNPTDPRNLWPESYTTTPGAKDKDAVENYLHKQLCAGDITLAEAQHEISTDWVAVLGAATGPTTPSYGAIDASDPDDE